MAETTKIEWCDHSWSPIRGCAKVSIGCKFCYAEALSVCNPAVLGEWGPHGARVVNKDWNKPLQWDRAAAKAGVRRRVFPSLCDWLEDRPDLVEPRARFLELIDATPHLDWLLLTKRPEKAHVLLTQQTGWADRPAAKIAERWLDGSPPHNVWFGVSVENQEYADERLPILEDIPAIIRWVSYEPALGPVDFRLSSSLIDWIVVGGESHRQRSEARPFDLVWARSTVRQCREAGAAVFVKQLGSRAYDSNFKVVIEGREGDRHCLKWNTKHPKGGDIEEFPFDLRVREMPHPRCEAAS